LNPVQILLTTVLIALTASVLVTPVVRRLARWLGVLDRPDGQRKLHRCPIPLGGGVAIFLAAGISILCALWLGRGQAGTPLSDPTFAVWLLCSSLALCAVGLIDDRWQLRGRQKLAGQIVAVGLLMFSGLRIESVQFFGWSVEFGVFAIPVTMAWMLGAINALNLIDGSDGVATTVGIVLSLALTALAMVTGHKMDAILAAGLLGALIGFLIYNFPPASVFLGDAGSMLIGLVLGVLAIRGALKGPATVALATPTALWAIPLFDVSMAILRRKLTGRSIYDTDRGHLHHCLAQRGFSGRKIVFFVGFLCACTAAGAFASVYQHNEVMALISAGAVVGTLVATRCFGHSECRLLLRRSKMLFESLLPRAGLLGREALELSTHMNGTREWDALWQSLVDFAERSDISAVRLNVSLPALHEDFHATWNQHRNGFAKPNQKWSATWPLHVRGQTVGRVELSGFCDQESDCRRLSNLLDGLTFFEEQLLRHLESSAPPAASTVRQVSGSTPALLPENGFPEMSGGGLLMPGQWTSAVRTSG
jgi:UDP-GlcNAc:undecaprenyl-phosphate GlcNAc-1-phosphate transferase